MTAQGAPIGPQNFSSARTASTAPAFGNWGQLAPAGAVVLTPEQAQQWQAYQAIDADPAALRTRLEQGSSALERETGRTLAEASGANADVLNHRLRVSGLRAEVREVAAAEGRPAGRAVHLLNAEGADQGELRAYATQHWGAFVPALFPTQTTTTPKVQGTVVSPQAGAGGQAGDSVQGYAARILAERQAAANPTPSSGGTA